MMEFKTDATHSLTSMSLEETQVLFSAVETSKVAQVRSSLSVQLKIKMTEDEIDEILDRLFAVLDEAVGEG
jgi:7-keto-8-aminopelargonate synthetase-like enzyme